MGLGTIAAIAFTLIALGAIAFAAVRAQIRKAAETTAQAGERDAFARQVEALHATQKELSGRLQQLVEASASAQVALSAAHTQLRDALEQRLSESATRTSETLGQINNRLSVIDEAQKNITALSGQVVSLQDILANKQARGAFGEIQLEDMVRQTLPPDAYRFQETLANRNRVDCLIIMPKPPGPIAVDSKFPLEAFRALREAKDERAKAEAQRYFAMSVQKHAVAIKERYIVPGETADCALMFLPSEAVYAELHSAFPEVVEKCHALRVYTVSPTTLMATLHTVRAILKDARMFEQATAIQTQVQKMMADVERLKERVGKLQQHFDLTEKDVREIVTSTEKILRHGERIANASLEDAQSELPLGKTKGNGAPERAPEAPPADRLATFADLTAPENR